MHFRIIVNTYTELSTEQVRRIGEFMESLRSNVGVCSRLVLRAGKLECVPVITGGREELAYSSARVYVVRRVARHKKKAFALIPGVALNEVVDLLERAYTYPRGRENTQEPREIWLGERKRKKEGERERGRARSDVASARETPKLVSTRGLNNNGMILPGLRDPTRQRPVVSLLLLFRCYDIRRMV